MYGTQINVITADEEAVAKLRNRYRKEWLRDVDTRRDEMGPFLLAYCELGAQHWWEDK